MRLEIFPPSHSRTVPAPTTQLGSPDAGEARRILRPSTTHYAGRRLRESSPQPFAVFWRDTRGGFAKTSRRRRPCWSPNSARASFLIRCSSAAALPLTRADSTADVRRRRTRKSGTPVILCQKSSDPSLTMPGSVPSGAVFFRPCKTATYCSTTRLPALRAPAYAGLRLSALPGEGLL